MYNWDLVTICLQRFNCSTRGLLPMSVPRQPALQKGHSLAVPDSPYIIHSGAVVVTGAKSLNVPDSLSLYGKYRAGHTTQADSTSS